MVAGYNVDSVAVYPVCPGIAHIYDYYVIARLRRHKRRSHAAKLFVTRASSCTLLFAAFTALDIISASCFSVMPLKAGAHNLTERTHGDARDYRRRAAMPSQTMQKPIFFSVSITTLYASSLSLRTLPMSYSPMLSCSKSIPFVCRNCFSLSCPHANIPHAAAHRNVKPVCSSIPEIYAPNRVKVEKIRFLRLIEHYKIYMARKTRKQPED